MTDTLTGIESRGTALLNAFLKILLWKFYISLHFHVLYNPCFVCRNPLTPMTQKLRFDVVVKALASINEDNLCRVSVKIPRSATVGYYRSLLRVPVLRYFEQRYYKSIGLAPHYHAL